MASSLTCCAPLSSVQSSFLAGDNKKLSVATSCVPLSTSRSITSSRRKSSVNVLVRAGADDREDSSATVQRKRRDLLAAGVAGGAAQLFLRTTNNALAVPITPPDLTGCVDAIINEKKNITTKCCLPVADIPTKLYVPKPGKVLKVRKRANALEPAYVEKYNEAYRLMRALPDNDPRSFKQQAAVHCAFCNGAYYSAQVPEKRLQIHFNYLFLPWHRYYIYFHERILGKLIGDPTFALPYWNWDDQMYGGNMMPEIFNQSEKYPALYDAYRYANSAPPRLAPLENPRAQESNTNEEIINNNISVMFNTVIKPTTQRDFMGGAPLNEGLNTNGSQGSLEGGPHTAMHIWVGRNEENQEDMGNFYSAGKDPLFYCHHANVDRCWYIWDTLPDRRQELYSDTDFLESSFVFYDENSQLLKVAVKDCLDTKAQLGITYEPSPGSQLYRDLVPKPLNNVKGVVPAGKSSLPKVVSKSEGQAVLKLGASETLSAVVKRPTGKAAFALAKGLDESNVVEVLTLEDVTLPTTTNTALAVYLNLPSASTSTTLNCAEYVGSFATLPHVGMDMDRVTDVRLPLGTNIVDLGIESQDSLVITVVSKVSDPQANKVTIGGFKIEFA